MKKEEQQEIRPLVSENNTFMPAKQIYSGFEIEKRFVLLTPEEDHTKKGNGLTQYNEVLEKGTPIRQGYIKDFSVASEVFEELGISLDFSPNTIRLRQYGSDYILTVKNRKESKKREVEWSITRKQFNQYWPHTEGSRIEKKRLEKKIKGYLVELDAFTDRLLLIAEIEVDKESELDKCPKLGMDVTNNSSWTNKTMSK